MRLRKFGHIAMIAGMLDPSILGYKGTSSHEMTHGDLGMVTQHDVFVVHANKISIACANCSAF